MSMETNSDKAEEWRTINGFDKYQVSNLGRIKSMHKAGRILKPSLNGHGYLSVILYANKNKKLSTRVHKLVAVSFHGHPYGKQINHKDGNRLNNNSDNLEWITCQENIRHAHKMGLSNGANRKFTDKDVDWIRNNFNSFSYKQLAERFSVHETTVSKLIRGISYSF